MFLIKFLIKLFFDITGWKVEGDIPKGMDKAILVAGGHTSNWDLFYSLATMYTMKKKFNFIIKQEALVFPLKNLLLAGGAIPIIRDPNKKTNYVEQLAAEFHKRDTCYLCIAAEGTRSPVSKWKSGFYHIAKAANAPIILCYLDYPNKKTIVGKIIYPTDTVENTMLEMKDYFKQARPKFPEKFITD